MVSIYRLMSLVGLGVDKMCRTVLSKAKIKCKWYRRKIRPYKSVALLIVFILISPIIAAIITSYSYCAILLLGLGLPKDGFTAGAIGGLLTFAGVSATLLYQDYRRRSELAPQQVYVIDLLSAELKRNFKLYQDNKKRSDYETKTWRKLGEKVTLLPRRLYTRVSTFYDYFNDPDADYSMQIRYIPDLLEDLYQYRKHLQSFYLIEVSEEDIIAEEEIVSANTYGDNKGGE